MIRLVAPTADLAPSWRAGAAEFPAGAVLHGYSDQAWADEIPATVEGFTELVGALRDAERGIGLPGGWVPCTTYWIVDDSAPQDVLGSLSIRHTIDTDFLREYGGHIGYGVRPSARRRGVATGALRAALPKARDLALAQVLLTCDEDNRSSRATIERCGGVYERSAGTRRRYWIDT